MRQFPGGASNLTYQLRYPGRDLILRRPPVGVKAKGAHDMGREYRIQDALRRLFPYVADDGRPLRRRVGDRLGLLRDGEGRRHHPAPRPARRAAAASRCRQLCTNALDMLIALHSVDASTAPALAALGKGEGYVDRQVGGWTDALRNARTDDTGDWSDVIAWLEEHQPADVGQLHDPQRLPLRQHGARRRRPDAGGRRARLGDGHPRRPADGPRRHAGVLGPGRRRRVLPACSGGSRRPRRACGPATRWSSTTATGWASR